MSRQAHLVRTALHRFPRVSGDEPAAFGISPEQLAFSPRERG